MCGRITIENDEQILRARFNVDAIEPFTKKYNAYPNHDAYPLPVITEEEPDRVSLRYWGMVPVWWKRDQRGLINIKYETLRDKRTFEKDLRERRCLVLANGFYEWKGVQGQKVPYYIRLKSGEPFAFAGLYEENKIDGKPMQTFAIITTKPNDLMQPIHNRMPVILEPRNEADWLNPDMSEDGALDLLTETVFASTLHK